MKNAELVLREILFRATEKKEFTFTQLELSKRLELSLSIINLVIKKLDSMGSLTRFPRGFKINDIKKILFLWASLREFDKDIIFKARIDLPVREIERLMPDVSFTAYSQYKLLFNDVPADYSEVYVYANEKEIKEIQNRISAFSKKNAPNLFILKKDKKFNLYPALPISQLFADLWNLKEWYAKEYITSLEKRMGI